MPILIYLVYGYITKVNILTLIFIGELTCLFHKLFEELFCAYKWTSYSCLNHYN